MNSKELEAALAWIAKEIPELEERLEYKKERLQEIQLDVSELHLELVSLKEARASLLGKLGRDEDDGEHS